MIAFERGWLLGGAVQLVVLIGYFAVAPSRDPQECDPVYPNIYSRYYQELPRSAQANLNLAVCLLQSVNQLTPASPAPRFFDTWKMLIGAELNCLGDVRGYVAGELPPAKALD